MAGSHKRYFCHNSLYPSRRMVKKVSILIVLLILVFTAWVIFQYDVIEKGLTMAVLWTMIDNALNVIFTTTAIAVVLVVILENRDPMRTTSWLLVLVLLPILGIVLYLFFGRNFRREKMFSRKELADHQRLNALSNAQLEELPTSNFLNSPALRSQLKNMLLLLNNSKATLTRSNRVEVLTDGELTFESMFRAMEEAQHHIHLEFYIIENDELGLRVKEILKRKAREGVEVRVIYDAVGSWGLGNRYIRQLKDAGVKAGPFLPVRFPVLGSRLNYRNHRKIVVVDGKTGFIGGINIGKRYVEGTPKLGPWRDTHLLLEGESVQSLQAVFLTDWYFVSEEVVQGGIYFPENGVSEECYVQVVPSGPDSDQASLMQCYFSAIMNAQEYVYITNPYFIPNESIITALKTAAMSGIDVRIILPGVSDSRITLWSSRSFVEELLSAGVRVYEYIAGFVHAKTIVADDIFSSIGSANMDIRSFEQNFEANALIYDKKTAMKVKKDFLEDVERCREILFHQFIIRPGSRKLKESLARLLSPIL